MKPENGVKGMPQVKFNGSPGNRSDACKKNISVALHDYRAPGLDIALGTGKRADSGTRKFLHAR